MAFSANKMPNNFIGNYQRICLLVACPFSGQSKEQLPKSKPFYYDGGDAENLLNILFL